MTVADKQRFAVAMGKLGIAFDSVPTTQRMGIYFEALESEPLWAVEWAVKEAIRCCGFFPRVKELRDLARIAPRPASLRIERPEERTLLEDLTPVEVAKERLEEVARRLNGLCGTNFFVGERLGRPTLLSGKR
jgi:hypothetical protein